MKAVRHPSGCLGARATTRDIEEMKNMPATVTNDYLRKEFDNFEKNEELGNLLEELKYSTLIVPMDNERGGCAMISMKGKSFIPLFTDIHEYNKVSFGENYSPEFFEFNFYLELIKEGVYGYIINVESERFPITKELLDFMDTDYRFDLDYQPFTLKEIRRIYDSIDNAELNEFLLDEANRWDFDGMMDLLFKSDILTVVASRDNLDDFQEDGVISLHNVREKMFYRTRDNYAVLFSSPETINLSLRNCHLYSSLVNLGVFIDFALKNDLAGIIVDGDIAISREFLMNFMKGFNSPSVDKYDDYAFLI